MNVLLSVLFGQNRPEWTKKINQKVPDVWHGGILAETYRGAF